MPATLEFILSLVMMSWMCFISATGKLRFHPFSIRLFVRLDLQSLEGSIGKAIAYGVITLAGAPAAAGLTLVVYNPHASTATSQALRAMIAKGFPQSLLALLCVVMAGVTEEILARGLLMREIERQFSVRQWSFAESTVLVAFVSVFASALVFAAFHGSLVLLPKFFAAGVVLALGYLWSGTLWVPIIAHVLHNFIFFVWTFLTV
jgi:membrane protease YdiL (CAAX protease family)